MKFQDPCFALFPPFSPCFHPFYPLKTPLLENGWGDPLSLCAHCYWYSIGSFYLFKSTILSYPSVAGLIFALFTPCRLPSWTTGGGIYYPSSDIVTGIQSVRSILSN
jgi:hypothetical protein